jgi:ATP-binding cassette subfamily B protein RaxB
LRELTDGMLFAFVLYNHQFVDKAARLVERAIEYRMLDLHLERLADIAGAEPEQGHSRPVAYQQPIEGNIEIRDLCFRYAEGEPFVLRSLNLSIRSGDYVAITGPSGCGKTTLLKVMLGLLEPSSGQILIDGVPLRILGHEAFRRSIGVVMQDDQLLSGSIADNICFFDESFELEHRMHCAGLAGIHEEICRMPMAYIQQPDRRHGHVPLRRPEAARAVGPRALPAAAPVVHGRRHLAPRTSTSPPSAGSPPRSRRSG